MGWGSLVEGAELHLAAQRNMSTGSPQQSRTAGWAYCASGWATSSPTLNLAARLKHWRETLGLIKPFLFCLIVPPPPFFKLNLWKQRRNQESAGPDLFTFRTHNACLGWNRSRFNHLFCLRRLELAFPAMKENNPTTELFGDVFG